VRCGEFHIGTLVNGGKVPMVLYNRRQRRVG